MSYIPEYHENYYRVEGTAFNQGKIGIGTINPTQLLHVSGGNFRLDGTGFVNGDFNITGNLNVYGTSSQFAVSQVIAEDKSIELNVTTGTPIGGGNYTVTAFTDDAGANDGGLIVKSSSVDNGAGRGVADKVILYRTSSPASGWVSNLRWNVSGNYGKDALSLVDPSDSSINNNIGLSISGTNTSDAVNLYRASGNVLATDDVILTTISTSGKQTLVLNSQGTNIGMTIGHDTNLYRSGANVLSTDDRFGITLNDGKDTLHLTNDTVNVGMTIGNDLTRVELYRASGDVLGTDDVILSTVASGKNTISLTDTTTNVGLTLGHDTNLYRSGVNTLSSDDLIATTYNGGKNTLHLTNTTNDVGMTIAHDTNLYRSSADNLRTDDNLTVDLNLNVNGNTTLGNSATNDTVTFNSRSATSFIPSTNNANDLGSSALNWANAFINTLQVAGNTSLTGTLNVAGSTTLSGATSVSGNTILGDLNSKTISFNGRANTNLEPSTSGARNLGKEDLAWSKLFVDEAYIRTSLIASGNVILGTGDNPYANDTIAITGRLTQGITQVSGSSQFTTQANAANVSSDLVIVTGFANLSANGAVALPTWLYGSSIEIRNRSGGTLAVYPTGTASIFTTTGTPPSLGANVFTTINNNQNARFHAGASGTTQIWWA